MSDDCVSNAMSFQKDAQARAYYACQYFQAVKENARVNLLIAGIQQAASAYFADKQHDTAKQAQNRLDEAWRDQKDKSDKLFNHWHEHGRPVEIGQLGSAVGREGAGYTPDYETAKDRAVAEVRAEFSRARQRLMREAPVHCVGANRAALRALDAEEAKAAVAAVNGAWRTEEARKDLKEAQYREEVYKWVGLLRGVVGESLNAVRGASGAAAAASQVNPYAGWQGAFAGLSNLGNALNANNTAGAYMRSAGAYNQVFDGFGLGGARLYPDIVSGQGWGGRMPHMNVQMDSAIDYLF